MKYLTLALLVAFFFSCSCSKGVFNNKDLYILEATKQTIHPGVQGVPSSKNYMVRLVVKKGGIQSFGVATVFDEQGKKPLKTAQLKVYKGEQTIGDQEIHKGDTLKLFISIDIHHDKEEIEEREEEEISPLANPNFAELLFQYNKKGKSQVIGVKKVTKKETIYAP